MRRRIAIAGVLIGVLVGTLALARAAMEVKPDKENVVASRLIGKWNAHTVLTARLTGREPSAGPSYEFTADPDVAASVPARYGEFLKGKQIYLAGKMRVRQPGDAAQGEERPFILICHRGNPHVVYFRPRGDDPMGDGESFNVMLAVAKDKAKDLLFIGGDFNNQPFSAFERVVEEQ